MKKSIVIYISIVIVIILFSMWLEPCDKIYTNGGMLNDQECLTPNKFGFFLRNTFGPPPPHVFTKQEIASIKLTTTKRL